MKRALIAMRESLQKNDLAALRQLLQADPTLANARPWQPQWDGTALESTAESCVWHRSEKHQLCRLLVEFGAESDIQTAARAGLLDCVTNKVHADNRALNATDEHGRTALYRSACIYGAFAEGDAVADFLIEHGADIDLYTACTLGMENRVHELLLGDPSLATQCDPEGITALHWAVRPRRNPATARAIATLLLRHGADLHATNPQEDGMMPLHHAVEWSAPLEVVDLLLASGSALDAPATNTDWTPLDYALDRGRKEVAEFLRKRGAKSLKNL